MVPCSSVPFAGIPKNDFPVCKYRESRDNAKSVRYETPMIFNTSRFPSKTEIEVTVLQIISLKIKAFSSPGSRLDRSGVDYLIRLHVLTANNGPIHVTIAGFRSALRKSGDARFPGFAKQNSSGVFPTRISFLF